MLFDISIVFVVALLLYWLFEKINLPGLLGMLLGGVVLGPSMLSFLDQDTLAHADELRLAALIVILIRAGLGINRTSLNEVGAGVALMGILPCLFEATAVFALAYTLFGFTVAEAGMMAFILAAVSPAVIVPQMIALKEAGYGERRHVPTLVLAAASFDDVIAITCFGIFAGLLVGDMALASSLLQIPTSIFLGLAAGLIAGWLMLQLFQRLPMGNTTMALLFMVAAILLTELEQVSGLAIASLLAVMAMGFIVLELNRQIATRLSQSFAQVWIVAEVVLFITLGASVDLQAAINPKLLVMALTFICVGLAARSVGVWLSVSWTTKLSSQEKLFCVLAFLPKATVQAAMGAIPLGLGVAMGESILAIAALSIVITAPLGAILIRLLGPRLLQRG